MVTEARLYSDLAIPPGELLQEELEARGMTQQELARRTGRPIQAINEIVHGKKRITDETALDLEMVLGIPAYLWMNLECDYELTRARSRQREELRNQEDFLKEFPVRVMERRGWIEKQPDTAGKVKALLTFFGVASIKAYAEVSLRLTPGARVSPGALAVWLRKGELDGSNYETQPYNEARFKTALSLIRGLTKEESPKVFVARLQEYCAAAGVVVVFVPELPGSGASGAARWLKQDRALIQLSLRYKTNDQLWFSFFHEACHLLRHKTKLIHVDGIDLQQPHEEEADSFARDSLIPRVAWDSFLEKGALNRLAIERFARHIGVAPGIVVGRLQHEKSIPWHSVLNSLKVHYRWSDESATGA